MKPMPEGKVAKPSTGIWVCNIYIYHIYIYHIYIYMNIKNTSTYTTCIITISFPCDEKVSYCLKKVNIEFNMNKNNLHLKND